MIHWVSLLRSPQFQPFLDINETQPSEFTEMWNLTGLHARFDTWCTRKNLWKQGTVESFVWEKHHKTLQITMFYAWGLWNPRRNVICEPLSFDNMHKPSIDTVFYLFQDATSIHCYGMWCSSCFFRLCAFALASLTGKDEFCHKCLWIQGIYDSIWQPLLRCFFCWL